MLNEEARKKIVETAIDMFNKYGCKSVTMDQIASTLHISKRTLYENFDNKETLLLECLTQVHKELGRKRLDILKSSDEYFLMTLYIIRNETAQSMRYARILQDSETYYPELTQRLLKSFNDRFKLALTKLLSEAQSKGDLRDNVNLDEVVHILALSIKHSCINNIHSNKDQERIMREACYTYLRGMLSIDAIQRYDANEQKFKEAMKI
ncbi:MAG: TetR/AcrR family transcriptional regulator [Bacteroidales bacterium]|nr:TetR/AcrR family transcriptional regulator [Bacteroidales bacterium]